MAEVVTDLGGEDDVARAERAYVGFGANLGDRRATIRRSVELLAQTAGVEVLAISTVRETEPIGVERQPKFLNGACELETSLSARGLLNELLSIENRLGRTRDGARWGPRVIDLDLLLFGSLELEEPGLVIPHPRLHERGFVLEPLLDLDPELALPDGRRVKDLFSGIK